MAKGASRRGRRGRIRACPPGWPGDGTPCRRADPAPAGGSRQDGKFHAFRMGRAHRPCSRSGRGRSAGQSCRSLVERGGECPCLPSRRSDRHRRADGGRRAAMGRHHGGPCRRPCGEASGAEPPQAVHLRHAGSSAAERRYADPRRAERRLMARAERQQSVHSANDEDGDRARAAGAAHRPAGA